MPEVFLYEENHQEHLKFLAEKDTIKHSSILFDREFESIDELFEYTEKIDTVEKATKVLVNPERLLFDTLWKGSIDLNIQRYIEKQRSFFKKVSGNNIGRSIIHHILGRMYMVNDIIIRSQKLNSSPLVDAETSWQYFNWKLGYDSEKQIISDNKRVDMHIVRALQYELKKN